MTPANPDALADAPYVLLKHGLFERPGHHGYTGVLRHAGRFSHEEASAYAVHGSSVTMMLASEAPAYSPACWHETQVEDMLDLLRIEREAKATAEARAAQLQAKVEAMAEALKPFADFSARNISAGGHWWVTKAHTKTVSATFRSEDFNAALAARAATAREGQADATELERLRKENEELQTQLDALVQEVLGG